MRTYAIKLDEYGISRWEYYELKAFCRQYDDKRKQAADVLSLHGQDLSGEPKGNKVGMPTEDAALKRAKLLEDIQLIEQAAADVQGGAWKVSLIQSCCRGIPYAELDQTAMPTSKREAFFKARREFFYILKSLRQGITRMGTHGAML